ncbi:hypothetical protein HDU96_009239 [Phlyctochytrium bullatum]|nr:hypothetical protein HDU96_009239 [Phlyctochytrium bullatum]
MTIANNANDDIKSLLLSSPSFLNYLTETLFPSIFVAYTSNPNAPFTPQGLPSPSLLRAITAQAYVQGLQPGGEIFTFMRTHSTDLQRLGAMHDRVRHMEIGVLVLEERLAQCGSRDPDLERVCSEARAEVVAARAEIEECMKELVVQMEESRGDQIRGRL